MPVTSTFLPKFQLYFDTGKHSGIGSPVLRCWYRLFFIFIFIFILPPRRIWWLVIRQIRAAHILNCKLLFFIRTFPDTLSQPCNRTFLYPFVGYFLIHLHIGLKNSLRSTLQAVFLAAFHIFLEEKMLLFIKILIFWSAKLLIHVIQLGAGRCLSFFSLFSCWKSLQCMLQYFLSLLASYVVLMVCI